jgi:AMP deaminase
MINSFEDMLDNFFRPLFAATACPTNHPKLAKFLEELVGFDSVDVQCSFLSI